VFNPVTTPAGGTAAPVVPAVVTVPSANIPLTTPGNGAWCVAKSGAAEAALQSALDYACGIGGADCSSIQPGAACFYPDDLQAHASVAFNGYYQRNPVLTSCDFGGTAVVTTVNPSFGSCVFLTSTAPTPVVPTPIPIPIPVNNPVPTPAAQTYSPPAAFNVGNQPPFLDPAGVPGYGGSPPITNNSLPVSS
ncbi:hypothetical protein M569_15139, partial [Genlisea aurea]